MYMYKYVYDNGNQSGAAIDALLELPPPLPDADEPASDSGAVMPYAVASPCIFSRICSALAGDGVPSKDRFQPGVAMLGTNHTASITNHKFVDKMYATEMEAGRMSSYGGDQSPPCWPLLAAPTGCVDKALRDGSIDPLNKRPTADYSWPVRGHWMSHLCRSSNERVDLERDFPWVYMMGAHDLIEQIQYLAALGDGVR